MTPASFAIGQPVWAEGYKTPFVVRHISWEAAWKTNIYYCTSADLPQPRFYDTGNGTMLMFFEFDERDLTPFRTTKPCLELVA